MCARQEDALVCEKFTGEVVCAPTIVSWSLSWLFVLRPSCRGHVGRRCRPEMWIDIFVKCLQVPREALEFSGMSINFRSGKFGYSICPFFSKGHAEIFREFWHDFAKKRDIWGIATNAWAGVS